MGENLAPRRSGELDRASGRPRGRPRGASCQIPRGKKWIWPQREHKFGRPVRQERCKRAGAGGGSPGPSERTPNHFSGPLNFSTPHDTPRTPRSSGSANLGGGRPALPLPQGLVAFLLPAVEFLPLLLRLGDPAERQIIFFARQTGAAAQCLPLGRALLSTSWPFRR